MPTRFIVACSLPAGGKAAMPSTPPPPSSPLPPPSREREEWAAGFRSSTGRKKHRTWAPQLALDPPPLLSDLIVVLVGTKRPSSVGAVARALSCFECCDLHLVAPRCVPLSRPALNNSKGAQYVLWRAQIHDTLADALRDTQAMPSVAITRWTKGLLNEDAIFTSPSAMLASPLLNLSHRGGEMPLVNGGNGGSGETPGKLVLVFGREDCGLEAAEVAMCDAACSIPIGRLQESLSLAHAVSLTLAPIFEARQAEMMGSGAGKALAESPGDLAEGVTAQDI